MRPRQDEEGRDGDEDGVEVVAVEAGAVEHGTKVWEGWRLSYRREMPELFQPGKFVARLRAKRRGFGAVADQLPEGVGHKSAASVQARSHSSRAVAAAREKRQACGMRAL